MIHYIMEERATLVQEFARVKLFVIIWLRPILHCIRFIVFQEKRVTLKTENTIFTSDNIVEMFPHTFRYCTYIADPVTF